MTDDPTPGRLGDAGPATPEDLDAALSQMAGLVLSREPVDRGRRSDRAVAGSEAFVPRLDEDRAEPEVVGVPAQRPRDVGSPSA